MTQQEFDSAVAELRNSDCVKDLEASGAVVSLLIGDIEHPDLPAAKIKVGRVERKCYGKTIQEAFASVKANHERFHRG